MPPDDAFLPPDSPYAHSAVELVEAVRVGNVTMTFLAMFTTGTTVHRVVRVSSQSEHVDLDVTEARGKITEFGPKKEKRT